MLMAKMPKISKIFGILSRKKCKVNFREIANWRLAIFGDCMA